MQTGHTLDESLVTTLSENRLFTRDVMTGILGSLSNHDDDGNKKPHKFAHACMHLTVKNSIFARFARAYLIFWHFADVLVLSTTWNDLFCSYVNTFFKQNDFE